MENKQRKYFQDLKNTGIITSKPRSGRPTDRETRKVVSLVKVNPRLTASQIAEDVKIRFKKTICSDTARKILKRVGYHGRVARKKPFISLKNRMKRIAFANEHITKPISFWESVLWSDKTKYSIFGKKGRQMVWRKTGTAFEARNLTSTVKHGGGGVQLRGCMAASGVGGIEFIENIMNKFVYLNILKRQMKQSADKLGLPNVFCFQQDNDPKHTAELVRLWLLYNATKQLHSPPQSPDLNPIEHLWALLERRIRTHTITSKEMLKTVILDEWSKMSAQDTRKLVHSMPKRLAEALKFRGYPTSY